jgi:xylan 1,4-beta-xylosidase
MLSRLGETRLTAESTAAWPLSRLDDGDAGMPEEIDALATTGRDGVRVLVWRHADDQYATDPRATAVTLRVEHLPFGGAVGVSYWRIDAAHSNSHAVWRALGAPQDPTERELRAMQERQELERLEPDQAVPVRDGTLTWRIALPLPSVSLLEIRPGSGGGTPAR